MNEEEEKEKAIQFIKRNKKLIIQKFIYEQTDKDARQTASVFSIFMAGSPGAGKTEFSKTLLKSMRERTLQNVIRIDADEIREIIPGYDGSNSHIYHPAASIGVEKIHDFSLKKNISFILDGTLSKHPKANDNIRRSLAKNRKVFIIYIYQDPFIAWKFTQEREKVEGRRIQKQTFVDEFFEAHKNVQRLVSTFNGQVDLTVIEKDYEHEIKNVWYSVLDVDKYINMPYSHDSLIKDL